MLFLAAGIRRSASTLVFQLACDLAGGDDRCIRHWWDKPTDVYLSDEWWVVKSHNFHPEVVDHYTQGRRAWPLVTIRDPRDIAVSIMELKGMTFDEVMEWGVIPRDISQQIQWADAGFPMYHYEDFVDNFVTLIWAISGVFGILVDEDRENMLLDKFSFESNKARSDEIEKVETDLLFPGHLQTGEVGRWKKVLTDKQAAKLKRKIGEDWFDRWGY